MSGQRVLEYLVVGKALISLAVGAAIAMIAYVKVVQASVTALDAHKSTKVTANSSVYVFPLVDRVFLAVNRMKKTYDGL